MNQLPQIPEYPTPLGRRQKAVYDAVLSMALSFDNSDREVMNPRRASATLLGILRAHPGWDAGQVERAAAALIKRRILKESNVGWSLHDDEFARLERQHRREREGFRGD